MSNRSNLFRVAVVALGAALATPALADTDMIPFVYGPAAADSPAGRGAAYAPPRDTGARDPGWNIANEPGFTPDARGALGAYVGRTPLAAVNPNLATDAYGAALNRSAN